MELMAFRSIEPPVMERIERLLAQLCCYVYNFMAGKNEATLTPADFLECYERPKRKMKTWQEMRNMLKARVERLNKHGNSRRHKRR